MLSRLSLSTARNFCKVANARRFEKYAPTSWSNQAAIREFYTNKQNIANKKSQ